MGIPNLSRYAVPCLASLLVACGQQFGASKVADHNPLMDRVNDAIAGMSGFQTHQFAEEHGWRVWYFQTDFGYKCVASKPAEGSDPAPAKAVFMRQSVGDLRMDAWLVDEELVERVPNENSDTDSRSRGYYRPSGAAFFTDWTNESLQKLDGQSVELKPYTPVVGVLSYGPINLRGINQLKPLLLRCDQSGPAH